MSSFVKAIEYHLPATVLSNDDLAAEYPEWTVEKIEAKTGISQRHIAAADECASDLAIAAAIKLFQSGICRPEDIDYVLLCTQSPDYLLPTSACLIQHRLGIPTHAGALDFNLGCSGYVYGLSLAKGLIETGQATNVLFLTAETYSKFIHPADKSVRTLFGDAAAATLVSALSGEGSDSPRIGPFTFGTDGGGAENLIMKTGGARCLPGKDFVSEFPVGDGPSDKDLYMNGPEIFTFTLREVPKAVHELLIRAGKSIEDIDLFVFHQANQYMLEHLRKKMGLLEERFFISMRYYGNTVSSTIPIALKDASDAGRLKEDDLVMLVGFGVGYSWGATLIRWSEMPAL